MLQPPLPRVVGAQLSPWIECLLSIQWELASPSMTFAVSHLPLPTFHFS